MAHDSKLTLISYDFPQTDASKETPRDLDSLKQDDSISVHGGSPVSSGEQEHHAVKGNREETSTKQDLSPDETPTAPSTSPGNSSSMSVPVVVVQNPSMKMVASDESIPALQKESEEVMEKVLKTTNSDLIEEEPEESGLRNDKAGHTSLEEESPDNMHSLLNCRICQLFVRTVDRLLDKSEEMMDNYMPLTEEEISNLKQAVEELDASPADHQKSACLDRITALSSRLRQRAYMMALSKLRLARRSTHSNLSQLHQTLDLIEHTQHEETELQQSHEKLSEICTRWTQQRQSLGELPSFKQEEALAAIFGTPDTVDESPAEVGVPRARGSMEAGTSPLAAGRSTVETGVPSAKDYAARSTVETGVPSAKDYASNEDLMILTVPGCEEENGFASAEVESKTLEMSRTLTLDLQGTYESLLANLKDLPLSLKRKLHKTYEHMTELHTKFALAHSFTDLPRSILEKGLAIMVQAQESMDEVMEFAFQNPMGMLAEDPSPSPVLTETPSAPQEEWDILKTQAAYEPKDCDEKYK